MKAQVHNIVYECVSIFHIYYSYPNFIIFIWKKLIIYKRFFNFNIKLFFNIQYTQVQMWMWFYPCHMNNIASITSLKYFHYSIKTYFTVQIKIGFDISQFHNFISQLHISWYFTISNFYFSTSHRSWWQNMIIFNKRVP